VRTRKQYRTDAMVDTEDILRCVEAKEQGSLAQDIVKACKDLSGSVTFGLMGEREPHRLYLVRHKKPMCLALCEELGLVVFASTEKIIRAALAEKEILFGFFRKAVKPSKVALLQEMQEDSLLLLYIEGGLNIQEEDLEFKKGYNTYTPYKTGNSSPYLSPLSRSSPSREEEEEHSQGGYHPHYDQEKREN